MSVLAAIAIAIILHRLIGFGNKYTPWFFPEWLYDWAPLVVAGVLGWDQWYLAVAGTIFAQGLLSVLDVGRDSLMIYYTVTTQGRKRR